MKYTVIALIFAYPVVRFAISPEELLPLSIDEIMATNPLVVNN